VGNLGTTTILILFIFGIVLAIVWILLPFAVFGMKPLLKQLLDEQRKTNALLAKRFESTP